MLKINNLKKEYKNFSLCVSLEIKKGQITGLIGQNGAGKSTLFKAILGLISFEGDITLFGKDIRKLSISDKEKLGVVLADSGFSGYLTVKDIIPVLRAMYRDFDTDLFSAQLSRFALPTDKKIKDFSTGMKAKLKVLTALSHKAELLILDEPTAGLDVVARDELLLMLREYMEKNPKTSVLISSHISSDLESLCDDMYMIDSGKIILHEDTDVLLSDFAVLKLGYEQFDKIDKDYILTVQKESFGYSCLTNKRRFYSENYPEITVEKGTVDGKITAIIKEEKQ